MQAKILATCNVPLTEALGRPMLELIQVEHLRNTDWWVPKVYVGTFS